MLRTESESLNLLQTPLADFSPLSSPRELSSEGSHTPRSQLGMSLSKKQKSDKVFCELLKSSNHQELQTFLNGFSEDDKLQFLNSNLGGKINTPLTIAISEGNISFVKCLINNGANVDLPRKNGDTPLTIVAKKSGLAIAKILLNIGANISEAGADINKVGSNGNSPLCFAVMRNNSEMVDLFLERGADTSIANAQGYTPLIIALKKGYVEIAKNIIKFSKADINKFDYFGDTAFISAIKNDRKELFTDFLNHEDTNLDSPDSHGFTPIIWAISKSNSSLVDMLIYCGANPGYVDQNGDTPLIFASKFHNMEIAQILCDQKIDLSHKNQRSQSALSIAENNKDYELAQLLSRAQQKSGSEQHKSWEVLEVDPVLLAPSRENTAHRSDRATLDDLFTPRSLNIRQISLRLMLAIISNRPQFVCQLLDEGAQVNYIDDYGKSPIGMAAEFGRIEILKILVERNPDAIKQRDGNGNTPLILAASHNKSEVVNFLIKSGADPRQKNNIGEDAFDTAMVKGYGDVVKELMGSKTSLKPSFWHNLAGQILSCSSAR